MHADVSVGDRNTVQFLFCDRQSVAGFIFGGSGAAKDSGAPVKQVKEDRRRKKEKASESKLRESEVYSNAAEKEMKY